jgi:hypothetical protein
MESNTKWIVGILSLFFVCSISLFIYTFTDDKKSIRDNVRIATGVISGFILLVAAILYYSSKGKDGEATATAP